MRTATSQPKLRTLLMSALALAGAVTALSPAHAVAAGSGSYTVRLSAPLASPRQAIVGEVLWKCSGDRCSATDAGSRPVVMCQRVARRFGEVAEFRSGPEALAAEDLAKCNAR